ncbi:MAG: YncE family protein [Chloroflexi bacterium]|nr:YncE family protein [Chloroflexota bacterium]
MKLTITGIFLFALAANWAVSSTVPTSNGFAPTAVTSNAPALQGQIQLLDLRGIGHGPAGVAILGDQVYVLNAQTFNIAVVENNRAVKFIPIGEPPVGGLASPPLLAADPAQKRLYVANVRSDSIALIENDHVALTRRIGAEASALLFFENHLFVGLGYYDLVLVLDPATLEIQTRIALPKNARISNLVGDTASHRVYTAFGVIDATRLQIEKTIPVAGADSRSLVAFVPDDRILISLPDSNTNDYWLVALDAASGVERGRVKISSAPAAAIVNADGSRVYLAHPYDNQVTVVDPRTMTLVASIPVGMQPRALTLDESAHLLYVANADSDNLSVINTDENIQRLATCVQHVRQPSDPRRTQSTRRILVPFVSFVDQGRRADSLCDASDRARGESGRGSSLCRECINRFGDCVARQSRGARNQRGAFSGGHGARRAGEACARGKSRRWHALDY